MITILTTKAISPKMLASLGGTKIKFQYDGSASSSKSINNRILNSLKAKAQPRRKDGRFSKPIPKPSQVENNPLVMFTYHKDETSYGKLHTVRLISANGNYYTGLDLVDMNANKWQYKKFIAAKAKNFQVMSFNEKAMS